MAHGTTTSFVALRTSSKPKLLGRRSISPKTIGRLPTGEMRRRHRPIPVGCPQARRSGRSSTTRSAGMPPLPCSFRAPAVPWDTTSASQASPGTRRRTAARWRSSIRGPEGASPPPSGCLLDSSTQTTLVQMGLGSGSLRLSLRCQRPMKTPRVERLSQRLGRATSRRSTASRRHKALKRGRPPGCG